MFIWLNVMIKCVVLFLFSFMVQSFLESFIYFFIYAIDLLD